MNAECSKRLARFLTLLTGEDTTWVAGGDGDGDGVLA